jgi:Bacterial regulatory proteins, tetR family
MIHNMPRPKAFDPNTALQLAVENFWIHGYEKTSLKTLKRETGVARESLYDTFGDKRASTKALSRHKPHCVAPHPQAWAAGARSIYQDSTWHSGRASSS